MSTNDHMYYVILILLVFCILIIGPRVFFPRQRIICFRRILQRRWNVATDDIVHPSFPLGGEIRQRANDSSYVATKEEAEKINMESLLKQLEGYTKVRA